MGFLKLSFALAAWLVSLILAYGVFATPVFASFYSSTAPHSGYEKPLVSFDRPEQNIAQRRSWAYSTDRKHEASRITEEEAQRAIERLYGDLPAESNDEIQ